MGDPILSGQLWTQAHMSKVNEFIDVFVCACDTHGVVII